MHGGVTFRVSGSGNAGKDRRGLVGQGVLWQAWIG